MVLIVNHIVPVTLMVMVTVRLEVIGVNVIPDGQDGVVIRSALVENMDKIV